MTVVHAHCSHSKQEQCCKAAGEKDRIPNATKVGNESGDDAAKDAHDAQYNNLERRH